MHGFHTLARTFEPHASVHSLMAKGPVADHVGGHSFFLLISRYSHDPQRHLVA
ncbi:hypothetical protein [Vibrio coralliilyticus]|uniref:hypothetical protein n=1 Tax=Vibrio coralliilyticus TaxID=190893 RepID=UPI0015CB87C9|nr:hypothetical protein [Vibrio coralliilyticus]